MCPEKKIFLSARFYIAHPFKDFNRQMELRGLQYMLERLVEQEKYGVAEYVRKRIHEIEQQQLIIVPWQYALRETKFSLN